MKRSGELKRTPMRPGSGFARKAPAHAPAAERVRAMPTRPVGGAWRQAAPVDALARAAPKEDASQSEAYMEAVRQLGYCMRCRVACRPQFCHRDQGKGTGIKTDVRNGWPGCGPCHHFVGTSGKLPKDDRRALEDVLGAQTRRAIRLARTWPSRLDVWEH